MSFQHFIGDIKKQNDHVIPVANKTDCSGENLVAA